MSTTKLRNKVYKQLETVDDSLLNDVLALIAFESEEEIYKLSDFQKTSVDLSSQQIKEGNIFTNEEVDKEIDAWLYKYNGRQMLKFI